MTGCEKLEEMEVTEFEEFMTSGFNGVCMECGYIVWGGIEPDAEDYKCPQCGSMSVVGVETAIMRCM
jgi:rubrerythrin